MSRTFSTTGPASLTPTAVSRPVTKPPAFGTLDDLNAVGDKSFSLPAKENSPRELLRAEG